MACTVALDPAISSALHTLGKQLEYAYLKAAAILPEAKRVRLLSPLVDIMDDIRLELSWAGLHAAPQGTSHQISLLEALATRPPDAIQLQPSITTIDDEYAAHSVVGVGVYIADEQRSTGDISCDSLDRWLFDEVSGVESVAQTDMTFALHRSPYIA